MDSPLTTRQINASSINLVKKLKVDMMPHPQPYKLLWYDHIIQTNSKVKVLFLLGSYSCEVSYDVILGPMISYHLLLGEQWCKEQTVLQDLHTMQYSFH